jgi:orotidine-5'-phosphate decarboxylase
MKAQEKLIVALDVPTADEALKLVDQLDGVVSFFKVGLELLMAGGLENLLHVLVKDKQVFVDLKLPDDIPETARNVVRSASRIGVRFLTLSHSAGPATIRAAVQGRAEGAGEGPKTELLYVPFLSSLDESDFALLTGRSPTEFHQGLVSRAEVAKDLGADGFIVSGQEIALLRARFPDVTLVSPGIRPAWSTQDDHKRVCTPAQAIKLGANYIVVGRPIRNAGSEQARKDAAKRIIAEIEEAEPETSSVSSSAWPSAGQPINGAPPA